MDKQTQELQKVELMIGRILAFGTYISALLMIVGIILTFFKPSGTFVAHDLFSMSKTVTSLIQLNPDTYLLVGLFLLILTPVLRVLISIILFVKQKDTVYTCITIGVLIILIISMVFGING